VAIKTILFLVAYAFACGGALYWPLVGLLGYMGHYVVWPERQWWGEPLRGLGIRYSFVIAALTGVGTLIHVRRLRSGGKALMSQEFLLLAFLALTWLSTWIGAGPAIPTAGENPPEVKLTKVFFITLLLTHIATRLRDVNVVTWAFVVGALYLGYQAFTAGAGSFRTGRLNYIGGPDFREANAFGAFLGACLPIIAVQFVLSGWKGRLLCLPVGVLATNAIVLTRSRGVLVGVGGGAVALVLTAPRRFRKVIVVGLIAAGAGGYALTDPAYWQRAETITAAADQRGSSSQHRLDIWRGSVSMLADHPLGVGAGNFGQCIGEYAPNLRGADAHSTFVRCYGELGIPGIALLVGLIGNGFWVLRDVSRRSAKLPKEHQRRIGWLSIGMAASLATFLMCGTTMTLLYIEALWWLLALPVCLSRAVDNLESDLKLARDSVEVSAGELARIP